MGIKTYCAGNFPKIQEFLVGAACQFFETITFRRPVTG